MSFTPNYKTYTLKELLVAKHNVCSEKYPKRTAEIELAIYNKENGIVEEIEEPQNVEVSKYSTFWPRFWASIVDGIVIGIISALILYLGSLAGGGIETVFGYIDAIQFAVYSVALHALYGKTLGKMALSVQVVDYISEGKLTFKQAFLRDCVPIIMIILLVVGSIFIQISQLQVAPQWLVYSMTAFSISYFIWHLLEIITMVFNSKNRALHDFIAGTVVVRT